MSITITIIAFGCTCGGALLGMLIRSRLPARHLSDESRDVLKVGAGLVGTLVALILGLLVSSAKSSFDAINAGITQAGAKAILLDRDLAHYGPEAKEIRSLLRDALAGVTETIWPSDGRRDGDLKTLEHATRLEDVERRLRELTPKDASQAAIQAHALQITADILQTRWLLLAQSQQSIPPLFLTILMLWLTVLYTGFGLLAPGHATALLSLLACALCVSGAVFLVLELSDPLASFIKVSSGPLTKALTILGT